MTQQVDILLATYQGAEFLDELLESIFTQTYPHLHLIIRDDGSIDKTGLIIEKWAQAYPHQCTVIQSTERLGIKGNFSELMKHSSAPYVMFADQDDHWLPHKIEASLDCLKGMERQFGSHLPLAVHTDLKVVARNLHELSPSFWKYSHLNPNLVMLNRLLPQNVVTGCTLLMNRSLVQLACPIPQAAVMHDWWVALVASCLGHIDYLHQQTVLYRQHGSNDTGAKPYKFLYHLKNIRKSRNTIGKTYRQAQEFLERYHELLSPEKMQILKAYCELENLPFLKKNLQIASYQFFKQGFLRNLKMLLE